MSIITQALKKAQRDQSQNHDSAIPYQLAAASQSQGITRQRWLWMLLPLGAAIAFGGGFWLQLSKTPQISTPKTMTNVAPSLMPTTPKLSGTEAQRRQLLRTNPITQLSTASLTPAPSIPNLPITRQPRSRNVQPHANPRTDAEAIHLPLVVRSPRSTQQVLGKPSHPGTETPSLQTMNVAQPPAKQQIKSDLPKPPQRFAKLSPEPLTAVQATQGQTHFRKALAAQKEGDLTQTEVLLLQTIALDPSLKEAYNSLGNIYYQRKTYQRAKSMYQHALGIDAKYVKAHNNLGSTYMRLAMYTNAITHLQQAISLDRDSGLAYYNLACVYALTGDEGQAAQYLSQAIDRAPAARIWARTDIDFAPVRTTPALQKLLGAS